MGDGSDHAALVPLHDPERFGSPQSFLMFAGGYWLGASGRKAWIFATAILVLLALNLLVSIGLNSWHRWFFDMLERRDAYSLPRALLILPVLILVGAACTVAMVKCSMTLQLNWRRWVTVQLLKSWSRRPGGEVRFEHAHDRGSAGYRIVQDVRLSLDPLVDMTIGFINALVQGATFLAILIVVGGSISFSAFGLQVRIPAYLALAAVSYALLVSSAMYIVGKPLVHSVAEKNEAESQFLFEMTRVANGDLRSSGPTTSHGALGGLKIAFRKSFLRWLAVIQAHCRLTWLTNSNSFFTPILPLILTAPKYVDGDLTLGAVIQIAAAFTIVLGVLNWFTDNYVRLAEWTASAKRVDELKNTLECRSAAPL